MTTDQEKLQQRIRPLVLHTIDSVGAYETAKGWLRYEALKSLKCSEAAGMVWLASPEESFDDFVDKLILSHNTETK